MAVIQLFTILLVGCFQLLSTPTPSIVNSSPWVAAFIYRGISIFVNEGHNNNSHSHQQNTFSLSALVTSTSSSYPSTGIHHTKLSSWFLLYSEAYLSRKGSAIQRSIDKKSSSADKRHGTRKKTDVSLLFIHSALLMAK